MIRRRPFSDLVTRQLDLFEQDHAALIHDCDAAEEAYDRADRGEAEERYGDYLHLVETAAELLGGLRDTYGSTLDEDATAQYEHVFQRAVARRFPRFAVRLEES